MVKRKTTLVIKTRVTWLTIFKLWLLKKILAPKSLRAMFFELAALMDFDDTKNKLKRRPKSGR